MTLEEYYLRMKAFRLQRLDREYDLHRQAYLNLVVKSTKERGKKTIPVYPTFQSFFDMERHEREILGENQLHKKDEHNEMKKLILKANTKGGIDE